MKMDAPTEYRVKELPNGVIEWQHRESEDMGGGVYKRPYPGILDIERDLADKFGQRFATKIVKEIKRKRNPLQPGATKTAMAANIAKLKREGYPQAQAVAIALREARGGGKITPPPRKRNYAYPDIASIKKVLGAGYVSKLVNSHYPRLAINNAHKNFAAKGEWEKASAVTALEQYINKAEGKRRNPAKVEDLTPAQLTAQIKKWEAISSALTSKLIEAGRGYEKFSDSVARAKAGDKLAADHVAAAERQRDLHLEKERRMRYSGSLKRVKNPVKVLRTKPVPVIDRATKEKGNAIASLPGGWVKVQWEGRARPTLIKESEIQKVNPRKSESKTAQVTPKRAAFLRVKAEGDEIWERYQKAKKDYHAKKIGDNEYLKVRKEWDQHKADYDKAEAAYVEAREGLRRNNPTVREQSEMFQGKVTDKVTTFKAANSAPSNLARVGKLAGLKLANRRAELKIPGAMVALDTRNKLWIVGNRAPLFNVKAKPGQGLDYGEIESIAYVTGKAHVDSGQVYEYVHKFGEDGGTRPRLIVDSDGMPLLKGGSYTVESAGIID